MGHGDEGTPRPAFAELPRGAREGRNGREGMPLIQANEGAIFRLTRANERGRLAVVSREESRMEWSNQRRIEAWPDGAMMADAVKYRNLGYASGRRQGLPHEHFTGIDRGYDSSLHLGRPCRRSRICEGQPPIRSTPQSIPRILSGIDPLIGAIHDSRRQLWWCRILRGHHQRMINDSSAINRCSSPIQV